jgi:hypothetical protein
MSLSQADRINISHKLVVIPAENAVSNDNKAKLGVTLTQAQAIDNSNKALLDTKTALINSYQAEIAQLDGNVRTVVLEQNIIDSANNLAGNFFSPNQISIPTPALPLGIWKQFIPYAGNLAVGKNYAEVYPSTVTPEATMITAINGYITTMETYSDSERHSGQSLTPTGTCSLPIYTTEVDCLSHSGTWTAGTPTLGDNTALHTLATNLVNAVNAWSSFIQAELLLIVTTDTGIAQTQNNTAISNINSNISTVNTWLAYPDFSSTVAPSKFDVAILQPIKDALTARTSFITTRIGQIVTNLGTIVQDINTGNLTTTTGLYGSRMNILNLRLNLMNGSLRKVAGIVLGKRAQDEAVSSNISATSVYTEVMNVTAFKSPSLGVKIIHVLDASGFSVSDSVYVVSDNQPEISTTIVSIAGNMITLDKDINVLYVPATNARLYKTI